MALTNKQPAVWTVTNDYFSVSEKGAIKPSGSGFAGMSSFITLDTAKHILANLDSFRKAVEVSEERTLRKEINKELIKMQAMFIRQGLTPEQAKAAVDAVLANKKQPA